MPGYMEACDIGEGHTGASPSPVVPEIGEAVFVKVENNDTWHTVDKADAERRAATKAYRELQAKVGKPISYFIGNSHPNHC